MNYIKSSDNGTTSVFNTDNQVLFITKIYPITKFKYDKDKVGDINILNDRYQKIYREINIKEQNNMFDLELNIEVNIINPAMEQDIKKYCKNNTQIKRIIQETREMYEKLEQDETSIINTNNVSWMYNILDGISEHKQVIFRNDDFIIVIDMKWNENKKQELHCLGIPTDKTIKSLRSLRGKHLDLLKNIVNSGKNIIKEKYDIDLEYIKTYVHYHPTFWHLHIHFSHIMSEYMCENNYYMNDVINNISMDSEYYQKNTLEYVK